MCLDFALNDCLILSLLRCCFLFFFWCLLDGEDVFLSGLVASIRYEAKSVNMIHAFTC